VASNCSVHANSTSDTAVLSQANISVKPTAASFCAVGGVSGEVEPHSKGECGAVSDPYKHVASAPIGACKREFLLENSFINTPENTSPNSPSSGPETELPSTNPKTVDEVIKALQLSRDDKMIGTNRGPIDEQRVTLEKIAQLSGEDMSRLIDAYGPYGEYMECFENPQPACEGFNNPFLETPFNEVPSISLVAEIFEISYGEFVDDTEEMDVPEIVETGLVELINGELYSRNNVDNELVPISANLTGGDILLTPGTYCGGLTVDGLRVRFSPGDYIFKDGPLTFLNQSQAEADKVTFGFRGSGATLNIESGSKLKIRSAISGPRSGLAFMNMIDSSTPGNRAPVKEINRISSGGSVSMSGTAYFPQQTLMISGENTNVGANSPAVGLIADKIAFRGQTGSRVEIGVDHVAAGIPPIQPRAEDGVRLTE